MCEDTMTRSLFWKDPSGGVWDGKGVDSAFGTLEICSRGVLA